MTATGVTFQIYAVASNGTETASTVLPAIYAKDIATGTMSVKIAQAIPNRRAYYFPKGDDAPTIKFNARLYGTGFPDGRPDQATGWMTYAYSGGEWIGPFANSLLKVTASEYTKELPVNSYWWIETKTTKRAGGYFEIYEMEIGLIRSFYTIKDEIRST